MKTLELAQGSPEWHGHRATHFNASDAPAMLGCSPYKTRSQLLHELHTGFAPEVDAATQRRFDDGHRFEALARPVAEKIIGEDLYPVVGTEGELSASFDGLTMAEDIAFEHKSLNDQLRAALMSDAGADALPKAYRVQMEQQCMVARCERVLFMASKWDGDQLVEELHAWYEPDAELRAEIIAGWQQFAKDLAAYKPSAPTQLAVAAPMESLPAVAVRVDGQLAITSNLPAFGNALRAFIDKIPAQPSTDQEFADTDAACKALKKAEDALDNAETGALAQLSSVEEMRRLVADMRNLARTTRLQREKMVSTRKDQIKLEILQGGVDGLRRHIDALDVRGFMPQIAADFIGAMKGKKTVASLRDAADNVLAQAKIAAGQTADRIRSNLALLDGQEAKVLFPDQAALVLKAPDDLAAVIAHRISEHEKAIEAARVKAEAEKSAAAAAAPPLPGYLTDILPEPMRTAMRAAPVAEDAPPTLTLGQIGTRLGFSLPAAFIADCLGIQGQKMKAVVMYHESDFSRICAALVDHIDEACVAA